MGQAKAWLQLSGETLLQRLVRLSAEAGAMAVVVVAAGHDEDDPQLLSRMDVAMRVEAPGDTRLSVALGAPDAELIDSIRAGLELIPEGADVLLWPVDAPFADAALLSQLLAALGGDAERIAVPVVEGKRGHPVLLGSKVAAELTTEVANEGAHHVVRRDDARVVEVPATDPRLVRDLNTPADARDLGVTLSR